MTRRGPLMVIPCQKLSFFPFGSTQTGRKRDEYGQMYLFVQLHSLPEAKRMFIHFRLIGLGTDRMPIGLDDIAVNIDNGRDVSRQPRLAPSLSMLDLLLLPLYRGRVLWSDRVGAHIEPVLGQRCHGVLLYFGDLGVRDGNGS